MKKIAGSESGFISQKDPLGDSRTPFFVSQKKEVDKIPSEYNTKYGEPVRFSVSRQYR
jgi:hypothetical protein